MVAADLRLRDRFRAAHVRVADDGQVLAEGLERTERARREIERPPRLGRRPEMLARPPVAAAGRPVHHLDADEPRAVERRGRGGLRPQSTRRHHGVEKRQRDGGTKPAQHGPAMACAFQ